MWRPKVSWRVRDALVVFLASWIGLPLATEVSLHILGSSWPAAAGFLSLAARGDIQANFILVVIDALFALGLVWLYLRHYQASWADLGLKKFKLWQAALLIVGVYISFLIMIGVVFAIISALVPSFNANQEQANEFAKNTSASTRSLSLIALVVIPPILEEVVFRGFMFAAFAKRWGPVLGAILSSALFAVAHLQYNVSIYTFVLGLLLCMMYYRLRSIWPGIFFHALNNYIAFVVTFKK